MSTYYCDPVDGNTTDNNGLSPGTAWGTFESVFVAGKIKLYNAGDVFQSGGPIEGGDTVYLMDGYHGFLSGGTELTNYFNQSMLTVAAASAASPTLGRIVIHGGKNWTFSGITINYELSGLVSGNANFAIIVMNTNPAYITIENCTIYRDVPEIIAGWDANDWADKVISGIIADPLESNVIIRNNIIQDIAMGIVAGGDDLQVYGNLVQRWAGDALRMAVGARQKWHDNIVIDSLSVLPAVHGDILQSNNAIGNADDCEIYNNFCITPYNSDVPFVGSSQGFFLSGCRRWNVYNNVIATNNNAGIYADSSEDSVFANNTLIFGPYSLVGSVGTIMRAQNSSGVTFANNIVDQLDDTDVAVVSNNIDVGVGGHTYVNLFMDWANGDFKLKSGSGAIDAGTVVDAPITDILGNSRDASPDIGAYEFIGDSSFWRGKGRRVLRRQ